MNLPNKLTTLRVILIPVFMVLLLTGRNYWALAVFIIASLTDFLDGQIARKHNLVTNFGKFMDPLADKLLVFSALLIFIQTGQMAAWAVMIVLTREFAVSGLRMLAASDGRVMAAGWSGKIKTTCTDIGICAMMVPPVAGVVLFGSFTINDLCVWIIVLTTLYSGAEYFIKNRDVFSGGM